MEMTADRLAAHIRSFPGYGNAQLGDPQHWTRLLEAHPAGDVVDAVTWLCERTPPPITLAAVRARIIAVVNDRAAREPLDHPTPADEQSRARARAEFDERMAELARQRAAERAARKADTERAEQARAEVAAVAAQRAVEPDQHAEPIDVAGAT